MRYTTNLILNINYININFYRIPPYLSFFLYYNYFFRRLLKNSILTDFFRLINIYISSLFVFLLMTILIEMFFHLTKIRILEFASTAIKCLYYNILYLFSFQLPSNDNGFFLHHTQFPDKNHELILSFC